MDNYLWGHPDQNADFKLTAKVPYLTQLAIWSTLQPTPGSTNWANLNAGINAVGSGKWALDVHVGGGRFGGAPRWIGCKTVKGVWRDGRSEVYPSPFDPNYQTALLQLISVLGTTFSTIPNPPAYVLVPPFSTHTEECFCDRSGITLGEWTAAGYSATVAQSVFQTTVQAVHAAFPNAKVVIGWMPGTSGLDFDPNGPGIIKGCQDWFNTLFYAENKNNGAFGMGTHWLKPFPASVGFAYQPADRLYTGVNEFISTAAAKGAERVEIYAADVQEIE